ncbi:MAG: lipopolysaccharide biosynthesis protein [Alphaproteobacteria bacterium]|jgi:O-antigen/teichoic acid export membrane protein
MVALRAALRSDFFRHISVLMGGTVLAQLIPLFTLPILSRIYTPETFAVLALMMMGAYFTASLSTGNFEQAFATARTAQRARTLASVTILISLAFAICYSLVLMVFYTDIAQALRLGNHALWMFAVPFTLLCGALSVVGNYWLLRAGMPARQSSIKLVHASVNATLAIGYGLMHDAHGLLYAFVIAIAFSAVWALYWSWRSGLRLLHVRSFAHVCKVVRHYREFPLMGALPTALSNLAIQLPLIFVTAYFSLSIAGHFSVIRNLLSGGLILVSFCIGQVLMKHLVARRHAGLPLWPLFKQALLVLSVLGVVGGATLYVFAPWFINVYLGANWADSGAILRTLAISSPLIVIATSLAPTLIAIGRIRIMGMWQLFYLLMSLGLLLAVTLPFPQFLSLLVAMECVVYTICIMLICWQVRRFDTAQAARA